MKEADSEEMSKVYFDRAYQFQMEGKLKHAIRCYHRSIELRPTAEAHTFLGWTFSSLGKIDAAIAECKKAIDVDPSFGNPYNDIGAYLVELGNHEDAVPWLKKAMTAERYEPRHFPHFNLGRIYELQGKWAMAIEQYQKAVDIFPDYTHAREALNRLQANLN